MNDYKREYCCSNCGLVWFGWHQRQNKCPECNEQFGIYACDTIGFFYAEEAIKNGLKIINKEIHYAKDHPYYSK